MPNSTEEKNIHFLQFIISNNGIIYGPAAFDECVRSGGGRRGFRRRRSSARYVTARRDPIHRRA
ncbi:hypothetical protein BN874_830004 [Candidatus Contendobacter odensis Run_B_J11]|uniref:Uncharacterized protein n=1 Tax=Candidatus Contendobacter odensis Run_B_J11 TaxID=1400861 RepID=A0A7U7GFR8_9GAMM|nr:hypothetical protein BN874_830004 [Candidatus Contendobacter odensis Run_B_J11]